MIWRRGPVIYLTEGERLECLAYQREVMGYVCHYGDSYSGLETSDRYYVGRIGELAVRKWANNLGLVFEETMNADGISDSQDFIFEMRRGRRTVNAKNSLHPHARYLMQPVAQHQRTKQDAYIGATSKELVDGGVEVRLWGVVTRDEFRKLGAVVMRQVETIELPLMKLPHTMEVFAQYATKKETKDGEQPIPVDVRRQVMPVPR